MATYNKEEFQEYLSTKVAESTAKIYATDMAVCVKALEKIKLYEGKELTEMLEDFVSHKKAVKNYLQEEFLTALTDIGSNDSGLYDSLLSKAKHYLAMSESSSEIEEDSVLNNQDIIEKIEEMRSTLWTLEEEGVIHEEKCTEVEDGFAKFMGELDVIDYETESTQNIGWTVQEEEGYDTLLEYLLNAPREKAEEALAKFQELMGECS